MITNESLKLGLTGWIFKGVDVKHMDRKKSKDNESSINDTVRGNKCKKRENPRQVGYNYDFKELI